MLLYGRGVMDELTIFKKALADEEKFRVFLSYSHEDVELVVTLDRILRENGFDPMWDRHFASGHGFRDQIRNFIAHAHVFIPVLTPKADERKWVHQEIGYAMAMNVPVLPIAVTSADEKALPGELIQHLHAIRIGFSEPLSRSISEADQARLKELLAHDPIELLIARSVERDSVLFTCADFHENRAAMLAQYADDVRALGRYGLVRQKGALSSFHIPTQNIHHRVWLERYGGKDRGEEHCRLQRRERIALTRHAKAIGCKLIIDPSLDYGQWGAGARRVRLRCLLEFLENMPDDHCQVAIHIGAEQGVNYTYVGNWFAAESKTVVLGKGYYQTIFTRHASSVGERIADFDNEFEALLDGAKIEPAQSREHAIAVLRREIAGNLATDAARA